MAGGRGTRLLPYTTVLPKPLMPIGDMPVMERLLRQLRGAGVRKVRVAVLYHRQLIQAYFGDGQSLGLEIEYTVESQPLGTCGALAQMIDDLEDDFLVMNADLVTNLDFGVLKTAHLARGAAATVALKRHVVTQDFGVAELSDTGAITALREKPSIEHNLIMGIYALRRDAVRPWLHPGKRHDMPDLLASMIAAGDKVEGYARDCVWLDIGRPEDYQAAHEMALEADREPGARQAGDR